MVKEAGNLPKGYSEIGDDVAWIPVSEGKLVLKVDMLVQHTDVPSGMTLRQAARKAVAMCVSDFAAKGARPDSFMVSLGLVKSITQAGVNALASGFRDAQREWGVRMVGGDTNEADELVIDCAMVGFAKKIVPRGGARPGEVVVVTGPFGYTPAGLMILGGRGKAVPRFSFRARSSVLEPTPNLRVGLALAPYLSSAMDSSDGLARSLHTIARESRVGFEVTRLPLGSGVAEFATTNGLDPERLVLEGGEEYVIVGTIARSKLAAARRAAANAGGTIIEIGQTTSHAGRVDLRRGKEVRRIKDTGWTHLSRR